MPEKTIEYKCKEIAVKLINAFDNRYLVKIALAMFAGEDGSTIFRNNDIGTLLFKYLFVSEPEKLCCLIPKASKERKWWQLPIFKDIELFKDEEFSYGVQLETIMNMWGATGKYEGGLRLTIEEVQRQLQKDNPVNIIARKKENLLIHFEGVQDLDFNRLIGFINNYIDLGLGTDVNFLGNFGEKVFVMNFNAATEGLSSDMLAASSMATSEARGSVLSRFFSFFS